MNRRFSAPLAACLALAAAALSGCSETPLPPAGTGASAVPAAPSFAPAPSSEASAVLEALPGKYRQDPMFRSCAAQAVSSCANQVVTRDAVTRADPDECDAVPDRAYRDSCRSYVATELAVSGKDLGICAHAGNMAASCASQAATRLASAGADASWCQKLPAPETASGAAFPVVGARDSCLYSAAMTSPGAKAKALCETVVDAGVKKACLETAKARLEMEKNMPQPPAPGPAAAPR